jgi:hypothetical protein
VTAYDLTFRPSLRARQEGRGDGGPTGAALRVGAELGGVVTLRRNDRLEIGENQPRSNQIETGHIKFE